MDSFAKRICQEIACWQEEGVISSELANQLCARYPHDARVHASRSRMGLGLTLLSLFAASLVGLGVISLIAVNWDQLSRPVRAICAIAPSAFCWVLFLGKIFRRPDSLTSVWRETFGLLWGIFLCAGMALVAQMYHIDEDVAFFILVVSLLLLPMGWLVRSSVMNTLWCLLPFIWMAVHDSSEEVRMLSVQTGTLVLLSVPGFWIAQRTLRATGHWRLMRLSSVFAGLVYALGTAFLINSFLSGGRSISSIIPFYFILVGVMGLLLLITRKQKISSWPSLFQTLLILFSAFVVLSEHESAHVYLEAYLFSLVLAVSQILMGLIKRYTRLVFYGALLLASQIGWKFFTFTNDLTSKAIVFLGCGLALALLHFVLKKVQKSWEAKHETV